MKNILLVNAHEYYDMAKGDYNRELQKTAKAYFEKENATIKTTVLQDGFNGEEEVEKLLWADLVIFQFPQYWMYVPALFKQYLDNCLTNFAYGKLYAHDGRNDGGAYGTGGLIQDKKYMFSVTMNAPKEAFNNPETFFEGKSVDDLFFTLHKTFQFFGYAPVKTFICHDIMGNPQLEQDCVRYMEHLKAL